jgi:hypothetical protein
MLNHAAWCNKRRVDEAMKLKDEAEKGHPAAVRSPSSEIVWGGKRFDELTSEEMAAYYASGI